MLVYQGIGFLLFGILVVLFSFKPFLNFALQFELSAFHLLDFVALYDKNRFVSWTAEQVSISLTSLSSLLPIYLTI